MIEEEISGASAPSAVTRPRSPADKPNDAPILSSATVRTKLETDMRMSDPRKIALS